MKSRIIIILIINIYSENNIYAGIAIIWVMIYNNYYFIFNTKILYRMDYREGLKG